VGPNPISHTGPDRPFSKDLQHLLLKISGDYHPLFAHQAGQGNGKETHATPDVEYGHARTDIIPENPPGVMHPAAERIVNQITQAPGTDMGGQGEAPLIQMLLQWLGL
jgi:hypothetical protein